ncbi:hypothetical protein Pla22_40260 [Rubripirellula amarantea]|uniref:Uncharacterized protein n=1 Tax=Rubripirellula amarantea TaxID=2527999 RepID=A0A5C5WMC8_9BACT|nr:hypothetical protein [Rubripirellula amarantea]TWT51249.1 hypothetical protein Pla22_40260 [Rubripirellula amarantea]
MNRTLASFLFSIILVLGFVPGTLLGADWHPEDDTFDPTIHSVVIGNASWIGDPSPFVHTGTSRTGYTYVNSTNYAGMDPSVQLSLMVPLKPGEAAPPAGGMLMLDANQTETLLKAFAKAIESKPTDKVQRSKVETALKDAEWALSVDSDQDARFLQLENKTKDKVDTYRFSVNASKKLVGAIEHSLKKLTAEANK